VDITLWSISQILIKSILYFGFATGIGGAFCQLLFSAHTFPAHTSLAHTSLAHTEITKVVRYYALCFIALASAAAVALFFSQVGALSDSGMAGIGDR